MRAVEGMPWQLECCVASLNWRCKTDLEIEEVSVDIHVARATMELVRLGRDGMDISFEDVKGLKFCVAFVKASTRSQPTIRFFWVTAQYPEGLETLDHESIDECLHDFARSEESAHLRSPELSTASRLRLNEVLTACNPDVFRTALGVVLSKRGHVPCPELSS